MTTKPNAIEKALEILMLFVPHNQEMGTVEVSQKLGLHKATASRIMITLARNHFLQQNPHTSKYRLGPSAQDIGRAFNHTVNRDLVRLSRRLINDLRSRLKETVVLEVLSGGETLIAYVAEGPQRVRIAGTIGDRLPVHAAAGGKVILAHCSKEKVDALLGEELRRFTNRTITDPRLLRRKLKEIRRKGFSVDQDEIDVGIVAIGAPIFDHEGEPIAAVVVAGPSQRIRVGSGSDVVSAVKEAAAGISALLLYKEKEEKA